MMEYTQGRRSKKTVEWIVRKDVVNYLAKISPHWQIINEHFKEIIVLNGRLQFLELKYTDNKE